MNITIANSIPSNLVPALFKQALDAQIANDFSKAEAIYRQLLSLEPTHGDSIFNLGLMALQTNQLETATRMFRQASLLMPSAEVYNLLGLSQMNNHQNNEAIVSFQQAITLSPNEYTSHNYLGVLLCQQHNYTEGLVHLHQAVAIDPNDYAALNDLAFALMQQGQYKEASAYFRRAIANNAYNTITYHNLLLCLCFDEYAFPTLYLEEARRFDAFLTANAKPYTQWSSTTRPPQQALRVGLVSGDVSNHPVGYFLESIISSINPAKIEIVVYNTARYDDELSQRIKLKVFQWIDITTLNDPQAAEKIHQDGIHLLIDLAGHTAHNRLSVFAWKPAPVQISWLGYFASTGLSFIDYFLADPLSIPPENISHFTETIWYLPETRLCFSPPASNIPQQITNLPAQKNGFVTFGCFQSLSKVNDKMLTLWAKILAACPNSKIMFKNQQIKDGCVKNSLLARLKYLGIASERVILEEGGSRANYFSAYQFVDFMLDTFPYPGGTTTCEALWMGVPTVTLAGNTLLERQGMAMLSCVNLTDWVAYSEDEYVQKVITLAHNISYLIELRQQLRMQFKNSPLMNAPRFAINFEDALLLMWHKKMK